MRAWVFADHGEPDAVLRLVDDCAVPRPRADQILVAVESAAVNFADALIIGGTYQSSPPLPAVAGMELSGTVVAAGPDSPVVRGDRVAGLGAHMSGAFGEYAVLDAGSYFVPPADYSAVEAACFTVAYQTAWFAVHVRGGTRSGDVVLVHAAAGGVGLAAVQIAAAAGARVIGVVGSPDKVPAATAAGCSDVLVRDGGDLVAAVKAAAGGSVDVVVDPVGGRSHTVSERVVGFAGRIVIVGFASGEIPPVRADLLMVKNYSVVGLHWGLYRDRRPDIVSGEYANLSACVTDSTIRPLVGEEFPFTEVPAALRAVTTGRNVGRVAVRVR
ncbi:zinc-binding dehydrogenase [Gordonia sp. NPDC127522]|uniref:zinc-binding dehydrogenase n=1 Tax=Gordonia sp. NPDC127522 TaxID=3345390 RepID=UPI00362BC6EE